MHKTKYESTICTLAAEIAGKIGDKEYKHARLLLTEGHRLERAIGGLNQMRHSKNPTETEAKHFKKVSQGAKRLNMEIEGAQQRINSYQQQGAADIENRISKRLGLKEDNYASEVRSALRGMDDKTKAAKINELINNGDGAAVAAITKAPAVLTGISQDMQNKYLEVFTNRHAPDLVQERDVLMSTIADTATILGTARRAAGDFTDPVRMQSIENAEMSAMEAESKFNSSFAGEQV